MRHSLPFACLMLALPVFLNAQDCVLPPRDCAGTANHCVQLLPFEPVVGVGYDNYPINGETRDNQYRSYARRDLIMLVRYAAAFVECKAKDWSRGNGKAIGLGDMSERNGAIPGTSIYKPGHPPNTHTNGRDMDIAYYQLTGDNNYLRTVCSHTANGEDVNHCTSPPTNLDVRRSALFIGALLTSNRTRVIGVDGKIEPLLIPEMTKLCDAAVLPRIACKRRAKIASETTNGGKGWFRHHHHHLHVSLQPIVGALAASDGLAPGSAAVRDEIDRLSKEGILGHALVQNPK
jgi:hypothetical protein